MRSLVSGIESALLPIRLIKANCTVDEHLGRADVLASDQFCSELSNDRRELVYDKTGAETCKEMKSIKADIVLFSRTVPETLKDIDVFAQKGEHTAKPQYPGVP